MAKATSQVTITIHNNKAKISEAQGLIPWNDVTEECSYFDSMLAKKLYPDLIKELQLSATKQQVPPVRLFDTETKEFPIGLLHRVTQVLEQQGIEVILDNKTNKPEYGFNFKWIGHQPRDYQEKIIKDIQNTDRVGCVVAPTGSGKSLIMAKLVQELGVRTLWVVSGKDLVPQTADFIQEYLGIKAGQFVSGRAKLGTITVAASGASLKKVMRTMQAHEWSPGLLLVDECHTTTYSILQDLNNIEAYYRYGFTATPFRSGGDQLLLEAGFGNTISEVSLQELQEKEVVAKVDVETIHVTEDERINTEGATWEEVYRPAIVEHKGRNNKLRDKILEKYEDNELILVDVEEIDHIDYLDLTSVIPEEHVAKVTGKNSLEYRQKVYNKFRKGEIRILIGTVLKKGLDFPDASVVVLAGGKGRHSKVAIIQKSGRGLRASKNKKRCTVIDSIDQQHYLTFQHCQARFKTMIEAGFNVPEEAIRTVQIEIDHESDDDIDKLKTRQSLAKTRRMSKQGRKKRKRKEKPYAV